jgi:DUF971 family protein
MSSRVTPTEIVYHQQRNLLEITYADGARFSYTPEFLRVFSPSAEVQGHGPGQAVLQTGKRGIRITALAPAGNYALKPTFSDGHDSGLFTWEYLRELGEAHDLLWARYLEALAAAGASRDPQPESPTASAGCGCGKGGCGR